MTGHKFESCLRHQTNQALSRISRIPAKSPCLHRVCKTSYASEALPMSDELDWNFSNDDEAKAEIRAAVEYLLRGATGGARGDIVQEIIAIVRQVAGGLPPEPPNSLDDGLPG